MDRQISSSFPSVLLKSESFRYLDIWLSKVGTKTGTNLNLKKGQGVDVGYFLHKKVNEINNLKGMMVETRGVSNLCIKFSPLPTT